MDAVEADFTRIYIGFEALAIDDADLYALATLHTLLGGGGSFSAGGPGKGMYSRLYGAVLNRFHEVDHCAAMHQCYTDSGLFGLHMAGDGWVCGQGGVDHGAKLGEHDVEWTGWRDRGGGGTSSEPTQEPSHVFIGESTCAGAARIVSPKGE